MESRGIVEAVLQVILRFVKALLNFDSSLKMKLKSCQRCLRLREGALYYDIYLF